MTKYFYKRGTRSPAIQALGLVHSHTNPREQIKSNNIYQIYSHRYTFQSLSTEGCPMDVNMASCGPGNFLK